MSYFNFDAFAGNKMQIGNTYFQPTKTQPTTTQPSLTPSLSQGEPGQQEPDVPTVPTTPTTYGRDDYNVPLADIRPRLLADTEYRNQYLQYLNYMNSSQLAGDQFLMMLNSENTQIFDQMHQALLNTFSPITGSGSGDTSGSGRKDKGGKTTGGDRGDPNRPGGDLPPIQGKPPDYPGGEPPIPPGNRPYVGPGLTTQQNAVNQTLGTAIRSAKEMFKPSAETLRHHPEFANKLTPRQIKYIYDSLVASNQHTAFGSYRQFKEWIRANPQGYIPVETPPTLGGAA